MRYSFSCRLVVPHGYAPQRRASQKTRSGWIKPLGQHRNRQLLREDSTPVRTWPPCPTTSSMSSRSLWAAHTYRESTGSPKGALLAGRDKPHSVSTQGHCYWRIYSCSPSCLKLLQCICRAAVGTFHLQERFRFISHLEQAAKVTLSSFRVCFCVWKIKPKRKWTHFSAIRVKALNWNYITACCQPSHTNSVVSLVMSQAVPLSSQSVATLPALTNKRFQYAPLLSQHSLHRDPSYSRFYTATMQRPDPEMDMVQPPPGMFW